MQNKTFLSKSIILLIVFAVTLNVLRVVLFNRYSLVYIIWNLFLAFIPYLISYFLLQLSNKGRLRKRVFIILGIVWLLFLPNSPYIVTDLIHIGVVRSVPVLYDSILLFTSAWLGLLFGMNSIEHIEKILISKYSPKVTRVVVIIVLFLTSFGMYLGRFLRFNSWDVIVSPLDFFRILANAFSTSTRHIEALLYTLLFFSFILISYYSWKNSNQDDKFK